MSHDGVLGDQRYPLGVGGISDPLEPYFGPAKRPYMLPADANLDRDSMTLAEAHNGVSERLTDSFLGMLRKGNDMITAEGGVFPKRHDPNTNFEQVVWKFDRTLADIAPDGAPPQFVTFEKETHEFHSVRRNIGVFVKHDWWKTAEGKKILSEQLRVMRIAVDETMNQSGILALLDGKNWFREYARRYQEPVQSIEEALEWEKWRVGIVQCDPDGLGWRRLHSKLDTIMRTENVTPDMWIVPPGMREYQALVPQQSTQYYKGGDATYKNLSKGASNYDRFVNVRVAEINDYLVDNEHTLNYLKRQRELGGYFVLADFSAGENLESYSSKRRDIYVYDLREDSMAKVTLDYAIRNSQRFDEEGNLAPLHEEVARDPQSFMRRQGLKGYGKDERLVDMFIVRNDDGSYSVATRWGELEDSALPENAVRYFAEIYEAKIRKAVLSDRDSQGLERGLALVSELSDFDAADPYARAFVFAVANQNPAIQLEGSDIAVLQKNASGGVDPPIAVDVPNVGRFLAVQPRGSDNAQFVVRNRDTLSGFALTGAAPSAGNVANYIPAPLMPFGYGNWVGMKTLAKIASQPASSPQRQLFSDDVLETARSFVAAVEKIYRSSARSFSGNPAFSADNVPFFFRTGNPGQDSITTFAQAIVDGNKSPFFVSRESLAQGTRDEEDEEQEFGFESSDLATPEAAADAAQILADKEVAIENLDPAVQRILEDDRQLRQLIYAYENSAASVAYARKQGADKTLVTFLERELNSDNQEANANLLNWMVREFANGNVISVANKILQEAKRGAYRRNVSGLPRQPESAYRSTFGDSGDYVVSVLTANSSAFNADDEFVRPAHPDNPARPVQPGEDLYRLLEAADIPVSSIFGGQAQGASSVGDDFDFEFSRKRRAPSSASSASSSSGAVNNMRRRLEMVQNIKSSLARYAAQLLLASPITLQQLSAWDREGMLVPVEVIGARPWRRFVLGTGILVKTPVGFSPYNYEDFMMATDVHTKYTTGHFTFWHGTVVEYPDRFILAEDIFFCGAQGGYDTRSISPDNFNAANDTFEGSVLYMMVPYGTYSNPETPLPTTFDITGTFDQRYFGDRIDAAANVNWDRTLFPSAIYYATLYDLRTLKWNVDPHAVSFLEYPNWHNTFVSQEFQRFNDPVTGKPERIIVEKSHLGPNIYGGMKKVLNGLPAYFKDMNYEKSEIPV